MFFVSVEICTGGIFTTITAVFKEKHRIDHFLTNFHKVVGRKVGGRKYTSLLKMFKEKDNLKVTCKLFLNMGFVYYMFLRFEEFNVNFFLYFFN